MVKKCYDNVVFVRQRVGAGAGATSTSPPIIASTKGEEDEQNDFNGRARERGGEGTKAIIHHPALLVPSFRPHALRAVFSPNGGSEPCKSRKWSDGRRKRGGTRGTPERPRRTGRGGPRLAQIEQLRLVMHILYSSVGGRLFNDTMYGITSV